MKVKAEIPLYVIQQAYTRTDSMPVYDPSGNYLGTKTEDKTFITVYIPRKDTSPNDELKKLTKTELIRRLEQQTYNQATLEVLL